MKTTTHAIPAHLALLAQLFERLDRSPRAPDGAQYRDVALRLAKEIGPTADADAVQALLAVSPAAAELYENMHYAHAGLCRSPLDAALAAEQSARACVDAARRRARDSAPSRRPGSAGAPEPQP
ncbi:MAG: hypothetical protein ABI589_11145 [Burkholderiales bacterium]